MRSSANIVFIGQFPPPINGLTFITEQLAQALQSAGHKLVIKNTTSGATQRGVAFHASRIGKTLAAMVALFVNSGRDNLCYLTAEGGLGLLYTLALVSSARLLGYRVYLHHHSFSYINQRKLLMAKVIKILGPDAVHICLSTSMAEKLATTYASPLRTLVVSNAGFVSADLKSTSEHHSEVIRIGLLSNLNAEKGLPLFRDILHGARVHQLPIVGVLAGPITRTADMAFVKSLNEELNGILDYRGPVYGQAKDAFFRDTDVFVFPTRYPNEAQPTVIFEALARGIPVISFDRGCIRAQVGDAGAIFTDDVNFVTGTLAALKGLSEDRGQLARLRMRARLRYETEHEQSVSVVATLFTSPTNFVKPSTEMKNGGA